MGPRTTVPASAVSLGAVGPVQPAVPKKSARASTDRVRMTENYLDNSFQISREIDAISCPLTF
jgi:hypothetical protein